MARMNVLNLSGLPWMKAKQTHEGANPRCFATRNCWVNKSFLLKPS